MRRLALVVLVACGSPDAAVDALRVDRAVPDYAPLSGGTLTTLHGAGFATTTRVLVDGRESPLVRAINDSQLELVVPPGERTGDVELVVFEETGTITAHGVLHYSDGPRITSVSPATVSGVVDGALITVTGSGFVDEGAGENVLLLDGQLVPDVTVVDDTTLTFTAFGGRIFSRPDLDLVNQRGRAQHLDAFRYTPGDHPGLLMFGRFGTNFAVFYDPLTNATVPIPALPAATRMRSVFREVDGSYWGIDVSNRLGRLDLETQNLINPVQMFERVPSVVRVGSEIYAIRRSTFPATFGSIDPLTGFVAQLTTTTFQCCGSFGLAHDGTNVWVTHRGTDGSTVVLSTFDVSTGATSTPVTLTGGPPGFRIEELRAWNGVLYGVGNSLVTIDPQTGAITQLTPVVGERFTALEPFE